MFDFLEILYRNIEGQVTKLSLWLGVDMTWPLALLVGIVILAEMFLPGGSVRK